MPQGGQGGACVLNLMRAGKIGQGQIKQAAFILKNQPPALFADMPMLTINLHRRVQPLGVGFDDLKRRLLLRPDNDGHAGFDDTGFFGCDFGQRVAQKLLMIDRNWRDEAKRCFAITLVASSRPPNPTFNSVKSAAHSAIAFSAAQVVISK